MAKDEHDGIPINHRRSRVAIVKDLQPTDSVMLYWDREAKEWRLIVQSESAEIRFLKAGDTLTTVPTP